MGWLLTSPAGSSFVGGATAGVAVVVVSGLEGPWGRGGAGVGAESLMSGVSLGVVWTGTSGATDAAGCSPGASTGASFTSDSAFSIPLSLLEGGSCSATSVCIISIVRGLALRQAVGGGVRGGAVPIGSAGPRLAY